MGAPLPEPTPGADLVDLWLGLITGLLVAGAGMTVVSLAYVGVEPQPWSQLLLPVGLAFLLATPLATAWGSRRTDWQPAGLRAVGFGLLGAIAAVPVVHGVGAVAGVVVTAPWILLAATGGVGGAVAAAPRATGPWSWPARGCAVLLVLLLPLVVLVAGDVLGPSPSAVAQSLWASAPLGVIPTLGLADSLACTLARRRGGAEPP